MTIKVFFLNRLLIRNLGWLFFILFYGLGNAVFINSCLANTAQPDNVLPPPPPLSPPNKIIKTKDSLATPETIDPPRSMVQNSQEEYIFSAPNEIKTSYKVEVFGKSDFILKQVREVEPKAFIKGNVIQVGIFSQEENALDLVKKLTLQGLWARVVVL